MYAEILFTSGGERELGTDLSWMQASTHLFNINNKNGWGFGSRIGRIPRQSIKVYQIIAYFCPRLLSTSVPFHSSVLMLLCVYYNFFCSFEKSPATDKLNTFLYLFRIKRGTFPDETPRKLEVSVFHALIW